MSIATPSTVFDHESTIFQSATHVYVQESIKQTFACTYTKYTHQYQSISCISIIHTSISNKPRLILNNNTVLLTHLDIQLIILDPAQMNIRSRTLNEHNTESNNQISTLNKQIATPHLAHSVVDKDEGDPSVLNDLACPVFHAVLMNAPNKHAESPLMLENNHGPFPSQTTPPLSPVDTYQLSSAPVFTKDAICREFVLAEGCIQVLKHQAPAADCYEPE